VNDDQLLRYSRQIMLPELDVAGQAQLLGARVLIIGLGGLGSPAALYLAGAGVGTLVLADHDHVEISNLQRQIAHQTATVGAPKVSSAASAVHRFNPEILVEVLAVRLEGEGLATAVQQADLVLDATDNFQTRHAINAACWQTGTPLVSGAAIRWEGQVTAFDPRNPASPCYRCLYPESDDAALNCADNGVVSPLVGVIGSLQALEAIKLLCGVGRSLVGHVLYFDAKWVEWRKLRLSRDPNCPVCAG
jgi:molybdopterin/thiamine biosynthesis adenylyltransferase